MGICSYSGVRRSALLVSIWIYCKTRFQWHRKFKKRSNLEIWRNRTACENEWSTVCNMYTLPLRLCYFRHNAYTGWMFNVYGKEAGKPNYKVNIYTINTEPQKGCLTSTGAINIFWANLIPKYYICLLKTPELYTRTFQRSNYNTFKFNNHMLRAWKNSDCKYRKICLAIWERQLPWIFASQKWVILSNFT